MINADFDLFNERDSCSQMRCRNFVPRSCTVNHIQVTHYDVFRDNIYTYKPRLRYSCFAGYFFCEMLNCYSSVLKMDLICDSFRKMKEIIYTTLLYMKNMFKCKKFKGLLLYLFRCVHKKVRRAS